MHTKLTKNAVRYATLFLLEASQKTPPTTTTLDVKNFLREHDFNAIQQDVAEFMAELSIELPLTYTNTKGWREYSLPSPSQVLASATPASDSVSVSYTNSFANSFINDAKQKLGYSSDTQTQVAKPVSPVANPQPSPNRAVVGALIDNAKNDAKTVAQLLQDAKKAINATNNKSSVIAPTQSIGTNVAFSNLDKNTNTQLRVDMPLAFSKGYYPAWSIKRCNVTPKKNGEELTGHMLNNNISVKNRIDGVDDQCWVVFSAKSPIKILFPGSYDRTDVRTAYGKITGVDFIDVRSNRFKRFNPSNK